MLALQKQNLQIQLPLIFYRNKTFEPIPDSLTFQVARAHAISSFLSEHLKTSKRDRRGMGVFLSLSHYCVPRLKPRRKFAFKPGAISNCVSLMAKEPLRITANSSMKAKPKI